MRGVRVRRVVGECPNYTTGHDTTTPTSGNPIYADIDYDWAQDLYGNVGLLWCDPGRYTFFDQSFFGLTTSSVMYQLGIGDGDTDVQVWEHDPSTYNRVGSVYTIQDVGRRTRCVSLSGREGVAPPPPAPCKPD